MSALVADGLKVEYGQRQSRFTAVSDVSFVLEKGRTLGLVGESGSGKSTVARAISGLVTPVAGTITGDALSRKNGIQMVFQDPYSSLNPRMTVLEMFREALRLSPAPMAVNDLAQLVHLDTRLVGRYPHELSGGQRQRVAIGRALAVRPSVLVLDEVTAALDVSIQAEILRTLLQVQDEIEFAGLFISHDLAVVRRVCDLTAVMYLGQVVEVAETSSLFADPQHPYTRALLAAIPGNKREGFRAIGEPTDPRDPPSGCRFHRRCPVGPIAFDDRSICEEMDPAINATQRRHRAACHFARSLDVG